MCPSNHHISPASSLNVFVMHKLADTRIADGLKLVKVESVTNSLRLKLLPSKGFFLKKQEVPSKE